MLRKIQLLTILIFNKTVILFLNAGFCRISSVDQRKVLLALLIYMQRHHVSNEIGERSSDVTSLSMDL